MKKIEYQLLNTCKLTKYILDVSNRKQLQRITIVVCHKSYSGSTCSTVDSIYESKQFVIKVLHL